METVHAHPAFDDAQIEALILQLLAARDAHSSCCPSEVARALAPAGGEYWRTLMSRIRTVAAQLARKRRVLLTRGSRALEAGDLSGGPIRIRRGPAFKL